MVIGRSSTQLYCDRAADSAESALGCLCGPISIGEPTASQHTILTAGQMAPIALQSPIPEHQNKEHPPKIASIGTEKRDPAQPAGIRGNAQYRN